MRPLSQFVIFISCKVQSGGEHMDKIKIDNGKDLIEQRTLFIEQFFENNPIFTALKLTDEQMDILIEKRIMPEFEQQYEVTFRAKQQAYFCLKEGGD